MQAQVETLLWVGKLLSGAALLLVLITLVDIWRRASFPRISYGGIRIGRRRPEEADDDG